MNLTCWKNLRGREVLRQRQKEIINEKCRNLDKKNSPFECLSIISIESLRRKQYEIENVNEREMLCVFIKNMANENRPAE